MPDFAVLYNPDQGCWLRFERPLEIVEIHEEAAVIPALQEIERRVETEGLYAAGMISYEAAPAFDPALQTVAKDDFPLLRFGLFNTPEEMPLPAAPNNPAALKWQAELDADRFESSVARIREAIAGGETYQVNYTFPMTSRFQGDPWEYFCQLVQGQQAPGAGFLRAGRWTACSASPELFFHRDGHRLTMRPMKGTAVRGRTLAEDRQQAEALRNSAKDQAENVMILDMVRNDLGRIAPPGSVTVEHLYQLEKYPTVWQLTSTAVAESNVGLAEIFGALFPCASITGAPKARTMQIIADLEASPRRLYTGCFGWLGPNRQARFNVAIRTVLIDQQRQEAVYGVGAGITWGSESAAEYRECLAKAAVLNQPQTEFSLFETLRWTPGTGYFLLEEHLARLLASAEYFDITIDEPAIRQHLTDQATKFPPSSQRVRLELHPDGRLDSEAKILDDQTYKKPLHVALASSPVDEQNLFLYHKTTRRAIYQDALDEHPEADDVLLWNSRGELTELTIGNLVLLLDGEWVTPPVHCGLLAGTYREVLLRKGILKEKVLRSDDLHRAEKVFMINAVRKWQKVEIRTED